MKELIQDIINKSGLSNEKFAEAVGTSASYLSQQKRQKRVDIITLIKWARMFNLETIESYTKEVNVKIMLNYN